MSTPVTRNSNSLAWSVVVVAGLVVLAIVWGLELQGRLDAGQRVLDGARPIFVEERVAGDRVGIEIIGNVADTLDPIIDAEGGAAGEVGTLVELVAGATGLTNDEVLAALEESFPHTFNLLLALPLDGVSAEIPGLLDFVAANSELPDGGAVLDAIAATTPRLAQAITNLLVVTENWRDVDGMVGVTRFDGVSNVNSVPEIRAFFEDDVITAVEVVAPDFRDLDEPWPEVGLIAPILTVIGVIVVIFGLLMMGITRTDAYTKGTHSLGWSVVILVGVLVGGGVLVVGLFPRLYAGQRAIDGLRPAFVEERIVGMEVGIDIVGNIGAMADPIVDAEGGAAGEVGALVELVAGATGLTNDEVLAALEESFPHTFNLLLALPLDGVSAEIPGLLDFVAANSELPDGGAVLDAIAATTPRLAQAITNLLVVTDEFRDVQGIEPLTRFDGTAVQSIPEVIAYFDEDVVAGVRTVAIDYRILDSTAPPVDVFPALLLIVGILVVVYGVGMLTIASASVPNSKEPDDDGGGDEPSEGGEAAEPSELVGAG